MLRVADAHTLRLLLNRLISCNSPFHPCIPASFMHSYAPSLVTQCVHVWCSHRSNVQIAGIAFGDIVKFCHTDVALYDEYLIQAIGKLLSHRSVPLKLLAADLVSLPLLVSNQANLCLGTHR